tara:strand:- start:82 stop:912 length:831 start_codon:yes stop_codon:yes gene_type:complete
MNKFIHSSLDKLRYNDIENPELDLRILISHSLKIKKEVILSNIKINDINIELFNNFLLKRLNRVPISKIINEKYFWKDKFYVNKYVLDPRPETELIIEEVLKNFQYKNGQLKILDIGTGSGCLAISLAREFPNAKITAIDVSMNAIKVASKNINRCNLQDQIKLKLTDFKHINSKYDIIVSNPPYLSDKDYQNTSYEIKKYEPSIALLGGKNGLKYYKKFAKKIDKIMKNNSIFVCEIGHKQTNPCIKIFSKSNLKLIKISKDLQNIDRTLVFSKI